MNSDSLASMRKYLVLGVAILTLPLTAPGGLGLFDAKGLQIFRMVAAGWAAVEMFSILKVAARRSVVRSRELTEAEAKRLADYQAEWGKYRARHAQLNENFLKSQMDWKMFLNYPMLTDVSVPETAGLVSAMNTASDVPSEFPKYVMDAPAGSVNLAEHSYPVAVSKFQSAWDVAFAKAKRVKLRNIPFEERKLMQTIKSTLARAENVGASDAERQLAYKKARSLLDKLEHVTVPDKLHVALEEAFQKMLTAA